MWSLLWVVLGVVAAALVIAYLADSRRGIGLGMTDQDRREAARIFRDHENRVGPTSDNSAGW